MSGINTLSCGVNARGYCDVPSVALASSFAESKSVGGEYSKSNQRPSQGKALNGLSAKDWGSLDQGVESTSIMNALMSVLEQLQRLLSVPLNDEVDTLKPLETKRDARPPVVDASTVTTNSTWVAGISEKAAGQPPNDIWFGLSEGNGSNSGILASIKAAMLKFGQSPLSVFTSVSEVNGVCEVVMRDGYKVTLTKEEIEKAGSFADFKGGDESMIKDATFMYAASAKRAQQEGLLNIRLPKGSSEDRFERAMQSLNYYCWASRALPYLGLADSMREIPAAELAATGGVGVVTYTYDATLMLNGDVDMYGPEKYIPGYEEGIISRSPRRAIALV